MTIEHLLPRTVGNESFWLERFNADVWKEHANRLGNLLLVSGRSNTKMGRKPFSEKVGYIQKKGGSSWVWTQKAVAQQDWTPELIVSRENEMIDELRGRFNFE